jgi:hypothetical protein
MLVFIVAGTCLPSTYLATMGKTHTDRREGFIKYAAEMGSGTAIHIPSLRKFKS